MSQVRLILALHNHQPVGNFEAIFEYAYHTSYHPFLEVLESYPAIPFVLHTSGPLLEWLVERTRPVLRLITCGGTFDYATHNYLNNVVVYSTEVR